VDAKREWFETDYYAVLGVARDASEKDIQKAYRKLARELHPDANPGDARAEERFKQITAAYDVIGSPETRAQYDQVRSMGVGGRPGANPFGGGGAGPGGFGFDVRDMGDLGDLLGSMFGGAAGGAGGAPFGGRGGGARRGRDQEAELSLSFDEAVSGVTTSVTVSGGADGPRSIKVRIPAGVADGQRIRLRGKGGPGRNGGPAGDLFVVVRVGSHPLFGREGTNLTLELPVTFAEAALGADVDVPTLDGETVRLRLPEGTQTGRTFRVRGQGIESAKGRGDLLVTVVVAVPQKLNRKQRSALEAFAAASDESPRAHLERQV
jgi:molecular chaperone DnaJ